MLNFFLKFSSVSSFPGKSKYLKKSELFALKIGWKIYKIVTKKRSHLVSFNIKKNKTKATLTHMYIVLFISKCVHNMQVHRTAFN